MTNTLKDDYAGVVVPEGYVLVPSVADLPMKNAGWQEADRQGVDPESIEMQPIWHAMLAAAPHPVSGEQKPIEMADAYVGAMEDRNIWKRRALEAEEKIRTYDRRIVDLGVLSMRTAVEKPAAQDVAGLVEALEEIAGGRSSKSDPYIARQALAAHRAQQGEQP